MLKRRLSLLAVVVAALFVPGAYADASAEEPRFDPPKHYYLALGDSITYGFRFSKLGLPPTAFNTGYVDVFATPMRTIRPDLVVFAAARPDEVEIVVAGDAARVTAICTLTLLCSEGDSHPTDTGYRAFANVLFGTAPSLTAWKSFRST